MRFTQNVSYRVAYADDIKNLVQSKFYAKESLKKLDDVARTVNPTIVENKAEMLVGSKRRIGQNVTHDDYNIEQVSRFVTLESLIIDNSNEIAEGLYL